MEWPYPFAVVWARGGAIILKVFWAVAVAVRHGDVRQKHDLQVETAAIDGEPFLVPLLLALFGHWTGEHIPGVYV